MVNFPDIRIKKYPKGWVVEAKYKKWWGKVYWKHIISVSGMPQVPWYYRTEQSALENLGAEFKSHIIECKHNR